MRYEVLLDVRSQRHEVSRGRVVRYVREVCDVVRETDCEGDKQRGREGVQQQRYDAGVMKCRASESSSSPCANSKYAVSHSHTVTTAVCSPHYSYYSGNIPRYMQY